MSEFNKVKVLEIEVPVIEHGTFVKDERMIRPAMSQLMVEIPCMSRVFREQMELVFMHIMQHQKIQAVKAYRDISGLGLKESKEAVWDLADHIGLPLTDNLVSRKIVDQVKEEVKTVTTTMYNEPGTLR